MSVPLRIGCVPYLNGVPLVSWFQSPECDADVELVYAVPSELARQLDAGALDVAMVSIFQLFRAPSLRIVPGISIAADGPVKSVRLFSCVPYERIGCVALDTSSLTSVALTRILLSETYGLIPSYVQHAPDLEAMLSECDAGLIIGDLKMFETPARYILDLGQGWKELTGLPFVYAAWLAREDVPAEPMTSLLSRARDWGAARLEQLSREQAERRGLSLESVRDYYLNVMRYDLDAPKWEAVRAFQTRCAAHGLVECARELRMVGATE